MLPAGFYSLSSIGEMEARGMLKMRGTLKDLIKEADQNKDGKIDLDELVTIMETTLSMKKVREAPAH